MPKGVMGLIVLVLGIILLLFIFKLVAKLLWFVIVGALIFFALSVVLKASRR